MKSYDISRSSFDSRKHYAGAEMQQGRVLTDHDFNENEWIEQDEKRRSRGEIIGAFASQDNGFAIELPRLTNGLIDFNICPGTVHLGGLRLDLEQVESYLTQKDWLQKPFADQNALPEVLTQEGQERIDLVYLEAWEQGVSAVEDEELLEVALGGPDTTTRIKRMRRVRVAENIGARDCRQAFQVLKNRLAGRGVINEDHELVPDTGLSVSCINTPLPQLDLCAPSAAGGYLGAENQAIRVQLVSPNELNWGFDNATPYYRVEAKLNEDGTALTVIKMLTEPKDQHHWPLSGQTVEFLPWSTILPNNEKVASMSGILRVVFSSYNPDTQEFTIQTAIPNNYGRNWAERQDAGEIVLPHTKACPGVDPVTGSEYYYMRVWNRGDQATPSETINYTPGIPAQLGNTGLQVTITGQHHNPGDYWIIAARPESPDVVVPWELSVRKAPEGIRYYYAPLALIRWFHNGTRIRGRILADCRPYFPPLNNIHAKDVKYDSGACPGLRAETVQEAIDQLCRRSKCTLTLAPGPNWWYPLFTLIENGQDALVCFQAGTYELNQSVVLEDKGNITFSGIGNGSHIIVKFSESAFTFQNCKNITINNLKVTSLTAGRRTRKKNLNGVISIFNCEHSTVDNVELSCADIEGNNTKRQASCLTVRNLSNTVVSTVHVTNSNCLMGDNQVGILVVNAVKTFIQANRLTSTGSGAGERGIVVAGIDIDDIDIRNNKIVRVKQGIRVGVSRRETQRGNPLIAGTTIISGNHIECFLPNEFRRERFGIFIGNCNSLVIEDNYVNLTTNIPPGARIMMDAIRGYGHLGKRAIVKHNHIENFRSGVGIRMHAVNAASVSNPIWIIEHNVARVLAPNSKFIKNFNMA